MYIIYYVNINSKRSETSDRYYWVMFHWTKFGFPSCYFWEQNFEEFSLEIWFRVVDLALNQSQTLVSPISRSLGIICGFVSENVKGTNLQPCDSTSKKWFEWLSWWFQPNPDWKNVLRLRQIGSIFPKDRGEHEKNWKKTTQMILELLKTKLYGCFLKLWYPKMDRENSGKPY